MHIITLMDYTSEPEITMCKSWLYFAKRYNPHARISIFHTKKISVMQSYASKFSSVSFERMKISPLVRVVKRGHTHHPAQDLQLSLWAAARALGLHKYIYVDADAFIFDSLDTWWNLMDIKPYIGIEERRLQDGTRLFNAGVFSYSDSGNFITLEKLIDQYKQDRHTVRYPAGEQGLLTAYFQRIRYNPAHPRIGHEFNALTRFCTVRRIDDKIVSIYSGRYPITYTLRRIITGTEKEWSADWKGWNRPRKVKILHAFGKEYKFWNLPECNRLWQYCVRVTQ